MKIDKTISEALSHEQNINFVWHTKENSCIFFLWKFNHGIEDRPL